MRAGATPSSMGHVARNPVVLAARVDHDARQFAPAIGRRERRDCRASFGRSPWRRSYSLRCRQRHRLIAPCDRFVATFASYARPAEGVKRDRLRRTHSLCAHTEAAPSRPGVWSASRGNAARLYRQHCTGRAERPRAARRVTAGYAFISSGRETWPDRPARPASPTTAATPTRS